MESSQFISTTEWNAYISDSATELYDLLIAAGAFYKLSTYNVTVIPGTDTYSLPSDFYKVAGVDLVLDSTGNAVSLKPFQFADRNSYLFTPTWNVVGLNYLRYLIIGDSIKFVPIPSQSQTVKIWYAPTMTALSLDTDTLDGINGWEEYVIIDAAIKALIKEESDIAALAMQKQAMLKRIEEMSLMRNIGEPDRVVDTSKAMGWEFWQFGNGG